jgi:hypothetical protein
MRLLPPACAVATAFVATVLVVPVAGATPDVRAAISAHAGSATPHRKHPPLRATLTFNKNQRHPFHSRIVWRVYQHVEAASVHPEKHRHHLVWKLVEKRGWRAGSGLGGRLGTDGCVRNVGWAPNGVYAPVQHDNYGGSYIKGRVFYLGSHACRNGTLRQNLFIHTEAGAGNTQCHNGPGDQHCRWETPVYNDYRSNGCIKMAPRDLHQLVRAYHRHFRQGRTYDVRRFRVRVIS